MSASDDEYYMRVALDYARRGIGQVAPNPSVGCVIVKEGRIISRGRTAAGGRPHAEAEALARAGALAKGASVYVTLEPCALPGRAGPCAEALVKAKVARVVVACIDPNPVVFGKGIEVLENAGIEVVCGVLKEEAEQSHEGFFLKITENRPYVSLKLATSKDGMVGVQGKRTAISNALSNRHTHLIRSRHDAILVGSGTYLIDTPLLTTRISGYGHDIKRYVLDGSGRVGEAVGFTMLSDDDVDTKNISAVLSHLAGQGVTRLLVEGGPQLHQSFLESGFVDAFFHTLSPEPIGEGGVSAPYIKTLQDYGLKLSNSRFFLSDRLDIYTRTG